MVKVVFTFKVPKEKQAEFLEVAKSGTKPWWESHGCLAYDVWQADGEEAFIKTMDFPDMNTVKAAMPIHEQNPECKGLIEKFESYTIGISRKPYIKVT
jgi:quinol monooxygenase YgiN